MIGTSQSTISRKIKRNSGKKGYRPKQAQRLADNRQSTKPKFKRFTEELIRIFKPYKRLVKTITSDNGKEFARHEEVAQSLSADFYFAQVT